jgi:uncharacterized protein (DUF427 family)
MEESTMQRSEPESWQESVWDYPRPPRLEPVPERLRVEFNGITIADTTSGFRVLETASPPTYYIPVADVRMDLLQESAKSTFCEWKGTASYWSIEADGRISAEAAWSYPQPTPAFETIRDYLSFYAGKVDACYVGDEQVLPQAGDFYGGWVTRKITGPFKGDPGTLHW